jgi:hypothetical protein
MAKKTHKTQCRGNILDKNDYLNTFGYMTQLFQSKSEKKALMILITCSKHSENLSDCLRELAVWVEEEALI